MVQVFLRYPVSMKRTIIVPVLAVAVACTAADSSNNASSSSGQPSASSSGAMSSGAMSSGAMSSGASGSSGATTDGGPAPSITLPTPNAKLDYQLGGAYTPPTGVQIVSRDRKAPIAAGLYNICYVNGFQIQPDELTTWQAQYPTLILRDGAGNPVIDVDWNEALIDVSTAAKRMQIAAIVGAWIDGCAAAGYKAVEIDNLDSYARAGGRLKPDDCVAMIKLFADRAHAKGLAIAQKNSAELVGRKSEMGTDFVVAEECNHYNECSVYTGAYGTQVYVIEYVRADFDKGCRDFPNLSIILRDRNLVPAGQAGYVYDGC
jgi:Glycoside-hydrolase family GH114